MRKYSYIDESGIRYSVGRWQSIKTDATSNFYFNHHDRKYYLDDFVRMHGRSSYLKLQTESGKTAALQATNGHIGIEINPAGDNIRIITVEGWWSY